MNEKKDKPTETLSTMGILSPSHQGTLYLKHFWYWEAHFHLVKCSISLLSIHAARSMIVLISLSYLITYPISPPSLWYFAPHAAPLSLWWTLSSPFLPCVPLEVACCLKHISNGTFCVLSMFDSSCCCVALSVSATLLLMEIRQSLCFMKTLHKLTSSEHLMGHRLYSDTMLCGEENASILYFICLFVFPNQPFTRVINLAKTPTVGKSVWIKEKVNIKSDVRTVKKKAYKARK